MITFIQVEVRRNVTKIMFLIDELVLKRNTFSFNAIDFPYNSPQQRYDEVWGHYCFSPPMSHRTRLLNT